MSDDIEVVLHAGMSKAGSTSIQNYLEAHRDLLLSQGILFPKSVLTRLDTTDPTRTSGHMELVKGLRRQDSAAIDQEIADAGPGLKTLLLSAEGIFHNTSDEDLELLAAWLGKRSVKLICIVRRQYDWLVSRYYESVTKGFFRETRSIDQFVDDYCTSSDLDYFGIIEKLRTRLGAVKTVVMDYKSQSRDNALIPNFMKEAGIDMTELPADYPKHNVSESFPEAIEAHRRLNALSRGLDNPTYRSWCARVRKALAKQPEAKTSNGELRTFGGDTRRKLANAIRFSNNCLSHTYGVPADFADMDLAAPSQQINERRTNALMRDGLRSLVQIKTEADQKGSKVPPHVLKLTQVPVDSPQILQLIEDARIIAEYGQGTLAAFASAHTGKLVYALVDERATGMAIQSEISKAGMPSPLIVCHPPHGNQYAESTAASCQGYVINALQSRHFRSPDLIILNGQYNKAVLNLLTLRLDKPCRILILQRDGDDEMRPDLDGATYEKLDEHAALITWQPANILKPAA